MANKIIDKFSNEEIKKIVASSKSYKEILKKLGYSSGSGHSYKTLYNKIDELKISVEHFNLEVKKKPIVRTEENVFCQNSTATSTVARKWYLKGNYTKYECSICNIPAEWNGKPLSLTLDHIDGNNINHELSNLRWICPNCDRQLPTYGSKNIKNRQELGILEDTNGKIYSKKVEVEKQFDNCKSCNKQITINTKTQLCPECYKISIRKIERPSRDELKILIRTKSFLEIARIFSNEINSITDNGIRKWCKSYDLPSTKKEIKSYSDEEWQNL